MTPTTEPQTVRKQVKHLFTAAEVAQLNVDFRQSYDNLLATESEFDNVKAVWKAKTTEAESKMKTLNATLHAGFELREKDCVVIYSPKDRKKKFFLSPLEYTAAGLPAVDPVAMEEMTGSDFELELIQAESKFDCREEIPLFPTAGNDKGVLAVGRLKGKWFAALRVTVGKCSVSERLDSEQKSVKERPAAVATAAKRALVWLCNSLGEEAAKGFQEPIAAVIEAHKERAE